MRTFLYVFAIGHIGAFLSVIVNRFEPNRLLATLLLLVLGVTAATMIKQLMP